MFDLNNLILYFLVLISETFGTVVAFGSSSFFVPLATVLLGSQTALAVISFVHVISNIGKLKFFHKGIDWSLTLWFGLSNLIFVIVGSLLTKYIFGFDWFNLILGAILLIVIIFEFLFSKASLPKNRFLSIFGGGISGFISGLTGMGGAIRGVFLVSWGLPKNVMVGTATAIDTLGDLFRFGIYIWEGVFRAEIWPVLPFVAIMTFTGVWLGKKLLNYLPESWFRRVVLASLFIIIILMFVPALGKL